MTGQELVQKQRDMLALLEDPKVEHEVRELLPATMSYPVFMRLLKNAALANPDLLNAEPGSVIRAVTQAAALSLNVDGNQSAIVVFGNKAQLMVMIGGVRKILAEYGWTLNTAVIYENDVFEDITDEGKVVHRRPRPGVDRGAPIGAYAMAVHKDGRTMAEVYDKAKIEEVRDKSARSKNIWKTWPEQMWEKTPAHRLAKKLPLDSKDLARLEQVFAETNGDEAIEVLYGSQDQDALSSLGRPEPATGGAHPNTPKGEAPSGATADIVEGEAEEVPFEGPEPDFSSEPTEADADAIPFGDEEKPTFTAGQHKGKTVEEVYALGPDGVSFLRWALKAWKTGTVVPALKAFAEEHPEIKS